MLANRGFRTDPILNQSSRFDLEELFLFCSILYCSASVVGKRLAIWFIWFFKSWREFIYLGISFLLSSCCSLDLFSTNLSWSISLNLVIILWPDSGCEMYDYSGMPLDRQFSLPRGPLHSLSMLQARYQDGESKKFEYFSKPAEMSHENANCSRRQKQKVAWVSRCAQWFQSSSSSLSNATFLIYSNLARWYIQFATFLSLI